MEAKGQNFCSSFVRDSPAGILTNYSAGTSVLSSSAKKTTPASRLLRCCRSHVRATFLCSVARGIPVRLNLRGVNTCRCVNGTPHRAKKRATSSVRVVESSTTIQWNRGTWRKACARRISSAFCTGRV
ncbi:hypothetical protein EYF80_024364 [Liparis tanakae]|uniref:Uncharacterized protein n=1 Tax=Liparis tanakae TaxID=230148 RepID=A0A4Z2HKF0_9TELE|nr:hypothetical protein EYF80_024364 [Liparis tanakae]